jgi:hypothetical protein
MLMSMKKLRAEETEEYLAVAVTVSDQSWLRSPARLLSPVTDALR